MEGDQIYSQCCSAWK